MPQHWNPRKFRKCCTCFSFKDSRQLSLVPSFQDPFSAVSTSEPQKADLFFKGYLITVNLNLVEYTSEFLSSKLFLIHLDLFYAKETMIQNFPKTRIYFYFSTIYVSYTSITIMFHHICFWILPPDTDILSTWLCCMYVLYVSVEKKFFRQDFHLEKYFRLLN